MMHTIFNATFNTELVVILQCTKSICIQILYIHVLTLFSHNKELRCILSMETCYLHYKITPQYYTFFVIGNDRYLETRIT